MRPTLSNTVLQHAQNMPQLVPQHDLRFPNVLDDLLDLICALPETAYAQFQQEQGSSRVDMFGNASGLLDSPSKALSTASTGCWKTSSAA